MTNYSAKHWAIKAEKSAEEIRSFITKDLLNSLTPDYSRVEDRDVSTTYLAEVPGYVSAYAFVLWNGSAKIQVSHDGDTWNDAYIIHAEYYDNDQVGGGGTVMVGVGDYYRFVGAGRRWMKFCPMKGVKNE